MDWKRVAQESLGDLSPEEEAFLDRVEGKDIQGYIEEAKKVLREEAEKQPLGEVELTEAVWAHSMALQLADVRMLEIERTLEMMAMTIDLMSQRISGNAKHRSIDIPDIDDEKEGWMN